MNKGFTLIELLGVLTLLSVIILVAVPSFIESNNAAKTNEKEDFNKTIEVATKDYINSCSSFDSCIAAHPDGFDDLFTTNKTISISVSELINAGFLKEDLKDADGNSVSGNISVTSNNGKLTVNYGG